MTIRIGINGFGRIGRALFRAQRQDPVFSDIEIVAVNDPLPPASMLHLLRYDSVMGRLGAREARLEGEGMWVDGRFTALAGGSTPAEVPWGRYGADYVVEATGRFVKVDQAAGHLKSGAKRVIISAPGKGELKTLVMGVNHPEYDPGRDRVVSNASCTTNCIAPVAKALDAALAIRQGLLITVHAYTNDQRLLDAPHSDPRRSRAAPLSMIPTKTGAAAAVGLVLPQLQGRFDGMSIRVPTPNVSMADLTMTMGRSTTVEEVNRILQQAADGRYLGYSEEPLVSIDYLGDPRSGVVDAPSTRVMGDLVKVMIWYDNEWGYSNRLLDLIRYMAGRES